MIPLLICLGIVVVVGIPIIAMTETRRMQKGKPSILKSLFLIFNNMRAETQMRIGLITSLIFFVIWLSSLLPGNQIIEIARTPATLVLFYIIVLAPSGIYAFALTRRRLRLALVSFRACCIMWGLPIFVSIVKVEWFKAPTAAIVMFLITILLIVLGLFLMWFGINGLRQIHKREIT